MKLFSEESVKGLAYRKAEKLEMALPDRSAASIIKHLPRSRFDEKNPRYAPDPPVKKILEYTPPEPINPDDPPPENIIWKGEAIRDNVEVKDACLLYLVR